MNILELISNEEVEWKRLGDVCGFESGYAFKTTDFNDEYGFPVIKIKNIQDGKLITKGISYVLEENIQMKKNIIKPGQVVISMSGATSGKIGINNTNEKFYANQRVGIFNPSKEIISEYLYYYLRGKEDFLYSLAGSSGSQPNILKTDLLNIIVPIPSLEIQEKIAKKLDFMTNYVTELQAELQAELQDRIKQYEYYRDTLLSTEYLNEISERIYEINEEKFMINFTSLGDVAKINRGASPRPISKYLTNNEDGIPWIKIGDIGENSKYVTQTSQKITYEGAKKSRILEEGDFIISNSMSYGRPYILKIKGAIHDGWASISDFEKYFSADFLYYYLTTSTVQDYWKLKTNSSSVSNLNSEIIRSLSVPIVSKKLQNKIVEILDKFEMMVNDVKGLLPEEIKERQKQYEYYREKLLTFNVGNDKASQPASHTLTTKYFVYLKEAADYVGVSLFEVTMFNLKEVAEMKRGQTISKNQVVSGDIPVVAGGMNPAYMHNEYNRAENHITVSGSGVNAGYIKYWNTKIFASDCFTIKGKEEINTKYIYYCLTLKQQYIYSLQKGNAIPHVHISDVENIKIPVPNIEVQKHIVGILDKFEAMVDSVRGELPMEISLRQKQLEWLMEKIFSFK